MTYACILILLFAGGWQLGKGAETIFEMGLQAKGAQVKLWSIKSKKAGSLTAPPMAEKFEPILKTLGTITSFIDLLDTENANTKNERQKMALAEIAKFTKQSIVDMNDTLMNWPYINVDASALLPASACDIILAPLTLESELFHLNQDFYLHTEMSTTTVTPKADSDATLTVDPNVLRLDNMLDMAFNKLQHLLIYVKDILANTEELNNHQLPADTLNLLLDSGDCIDRSAAEIINLNECRTTPAGFTCFFDIITLSALPSGYNYIAYPFLTQRGDHAYTVKHDAGILLNQDEDKKLDLGLCSKIQNKYVCEKNSWHTDKCLEAVKSRNGEDAIESCKFTRQSLNSSPFIKQTEKGLLIAPRDKSEVAVTWTLSSEGDSKEIEELKVNYPVVLTGTGTVIVQVDGGIHKILIKNTQTNTKDTVPKIIAPKYPASADGPNTRVVIKTVLKSRHG